MDVRGRLVGAALVGALALLAGPAAAPAPATDISQQDGEGQRIGAGAGFGRTILVLDSSGSMAEPSGGGETKIIAAREALRTVVGDLPDDAVVGLRVFGAEVTLDEGGSCTDSQLVVEPGTDNRDDLLSAIEDYEPYGETPIPHALQEAARDLGDEGARSIVLISDGESTCQPDACQVAGELAAQGIDLRIDVVGLSVSGEARSQLECIAAAGGGTFYAADDADDIRADLTRVAERAVRPFTLTGLPITGGTMASPAPIGLGDWIDTFGESGTDSGTRSYVVERTAAGSTLRVSAVTQGRQGDEGLRIEISGPDGTRCDISSTLRQIDARDVVAVQATAAEETDCAAPGRYLITVERRLGDEQDISVGLRVTEEPPFTDIGFVGDGEVEVTAPQVSGEATEVVGGTSFANATALESGRYSSTVVPGEALMFKVALEHGQSARVRVTFPAASAALRDVVGLFPPLANVTMYNPMHGLLDNPRGATVSQAVGDDEQHDLVTATAAISRALVDAGGSSGVADYSTAGDHYVGVSLMRRDYGAEFPFIIEVEVLGDPQAGPTYDGGATWSVAEGTAGGESPSPTPSEQPASASEQPASPSEQPASAAQDDAAEGGVGVPAGVAAVLGLPVLIGASLLWRRRATSI